jgi:RNA polymerase-binding protein DksA
VTKAELEHFRQQLLNLWRRLRGDVKNLASEAFRTAGGEASGNLSNTPVHMADLGTDNFEQEMSMALLENEGQSLEEINAALERIEKGTYGRCRECQKEIARERLRALPFTPLCVDCARKAQEDAGVEGQKPAKL